MIEVRNLTKKYGSNLAVNNISFNIEKGKVYGFLGPNGAGKSTTMNIITGCLAATSGTVLIDGHDIFDEPVEAKKHIGYLPEIPPLYVEMTPLEYLTFVSEAKGVPFDKRYTEIKTVLKLTGLEEKAGKLIRNMSKGYKQRVGIAQAMIGDPDVIILDEPTVGLDPKQIIEIRELIAALGKKKTVIISSHILSEISEICDNIIIISHGRVVADDTLENLEYKASRANGLSITAKCNKSKLAAIVGAIAGVSCGEITEKDDRASAILNSDDTFKGELTEVVFNAFADARVPLTELQYKESSLESIFLELTSEQAEVKKAIAPDIPPVSGDSDKSGETEEKQDETAAIGEDDYVPLFGTNDEEDEK